MYLGIDCGTQGTKALLIDEQGIAHGRGHATHQVIQRSSGAREQDPQWWIEALQLSVKQAIAQAPGHPIKALAVSGQQHGLVVLDERMQVIRPAKLWNDTETATQNAELIARFGGQQAFFERFGIIPLTGYTVSKLLWLQQREPENFARIRHILLPHDYLNFWLTGNLWAEYGDASGTGYFDVRNRTWAAEVLASIDQGTGHLLRALPTLVPAQRIIGTVKSDVAADLGISNTCLVASGGGDNMMGAIGTGNVTEGVVTMSLGTSATVYSFRNEPAASPNSSISPFCSSSNGWLPLVCTMNATNVVTQILDTLGRTVTDIESALATTVPGADALTFIPFLNGERTPDLPSAHGVILGISASNFTPENLIRATIEGVSFGILEGLDLILDGTNAKRILLIGGGSRSAQWRQLLADASGTDVQVPLEEEAGCLGACIQAIFAARSDMGSPETFIEICDRCIKLDNQRTASPDPVLASQYAQARAAYKHHRATQYDV
ncbi:xylulokinase [Tunturibacter empetritectus]|uniref:Xylulose kinase n=1 Tax=Tunturiibacter lichenicola TaxID=2051959 RepID=A0A7W8J3U6_9BACT|nr:xylulokinase [Edaphobacter lichenicola]MBB5342052.1 xylulokinase [Edaphobacter lichenicola]